MGKLPATSYVRLVDIWLIFGQLLPFVEVLIFTKARPDRHFIKMILLKVSLTTVAELYNEDDSVINHHGFERNVNKEDNERKLQVSKFRKRNMIAKFIGEFAVNHHLTMYNVRCLCLLID